MSTLSSINEKLFLVLCPESRDMWALQADDPGDAIMKALKDGPLRETSTEEMALMAGESFQHIVFELTDGEFFDSEIVPTEEGIRLHCRSTDVPEDLLS